MKKLIVIIVIFITSLNLFGCIKEKSSNEVIEKKESIVLGVRKLPETLDIDELYSKEDNQIIYSLFDGLVELNESGNLSAALAESWEVKENGLEYIFKLRENITWSNGEKIIANDFVEFFSQILKSKEDWVKDLYSIYGVKEYAEGSASFEKTVSIIAVEDKILKIRMNNKDDKILYKLTKPQFKLRKISNDLKSYKENYKNIITTGAYKINKIEQDETIELKRNEYYWDEETTSPDKILVKSSGVGEKALVSLLMNEIDILSDIPSSEVGELMKKGSIDIFPLKLTKILEFNDKKDNIISNSNFRKAIEKSIVWELSDFGIITNFKGELAQGKLERNRENGVIKVSLNSNFDYEKEKQYSKLLAKEFIKNSNYSKENIVLIGELTNENQELSEFIKKSVKSSIKIPIEIKLYDKKTLYDLINKNDYDILIKNYEYNSNSTELSDVENKLINNGYVVPLYFQNLFTCKSENIKYVSYYGDGVLKIKYINVEEK